MVTSLPRIALVVLLLAACGKGGSSKDNAKRDSGLTGPVAAPISLPVLGVDRISRFSFLYDAGSAAYKKANEAAGKKDWAEARKHAEAALAKDPSHLDARRLLGIALVQTGDPAAAVDHLAAAIAADYYKYGAELGGTAELKDFFATQHGQAVLQLAEQIRDEYAKRIKNGLWLVGRRASFKWPAKPGSQPGTSRGELYAFDRDSKRYLRLTHTSDQAAGFVRSRSGNEVAVLGYDRIDRPAGADATPLLARAWVQAFDTTDWQNTTPKVTLGPARAISIYFGDGDQLLVATAPATGRWTLGEWTVHSVDRTTGKLTKVATQLGAPRIELTLDEGRIVPPRSIAGIPAPWTGDPPRAPTLQLAGGTPAIQIPESGQAAMETVSVAPGGGFIAFATAVDPCAKDTAPSLYIGSGKNGALKHLLTNRSRFATRWLDATTLAYEDGDGAIRLWDATTQREALRVDNKAGVGLEVLSLASAPLCKLAPPVVEPAGAGDEPPLPPEEPAGDQPVTKPQ
jgi:hypothetical protein